MCALSLHGFDLTIEESIEPKIVLYPFRHDLGDAPDRHRWRAQWKSGYDGRLCGIALSAHPVVRKTRCGAWVDPFAYLRATKQPWEEGAPGYRWSTAEPGCKTLKWVSDDGAQAWAKPTQDEAIHSIAIRLTRWAQRLRQDNLKVRAAAEALAVLRPDLKTYSKAALSTLDGERSAI